MSPTSQGSGSDSYFSRAKQSQGSNNARDLPDSGTKNGADAPRALAWQPGLAQSPGDLPVSPQTLTAEQWVQQRATLASHPRAPTYSHARNKSSAGSLYRTASRTPPFPSPTDGASPSPISRNSSGDWSQLIHQRTPSGERLQAAGNRPSSRASMLNPTAEKPVSRHSPIERPVSRHSTLMMTPAVDLSKLNARERERVAKATGTPMLGMPGNERVQVQSKPMGLVGAIAAREEEKELSKEGARSIAVEQAIKSALIQKHQSEMAHLRHSQWQQNREMPARQSVYGMPQGYQSTMSLGGSIHGMPQQQLSTPSLLQQQMYPTQQMQRPMSMALDTGLENVPMMGYGQQFPNVHPYGQSQQRAPSVHELQQYVRNNPTPYGASAMAPQLGQGTDRRQSMLSMQSFSAGAIPSQPNQRYPSQPQWQ